MTLNKEPYIKVPTWILTVLTPLLVSGIVSFGVIRANFATEKQKTQNLTETVDRLEARKVDRSEFNMLLLQLSEINKKLDKQ